MRILHLIKSLGRGGAEMLLPETIALHDRNRFEFHCIYFLPWKNQMVSYLEDAGVTVTCMQATNNIRIMTKARAISQYCRQHQIDLIHCHLPWAGFVGRVVQRLTNIPVIYTEHNKQERYNKITARLNKFSFNWQQLAIAVSDDVAASIKKNIAPSIPVLTVLNGVNTQKFRRDERKGNLLREQFGIDGQDIVIGTVAVFRFQKRLELWLEVMKVITDKFPNVRGVIVGDGPLKDEIIEKRKALQLEDKVIMPGLQTNTIDWYSCMDVFMMSSVFEGLPIALLEAMSCGCAIVSTTAGGVKEVIRQSKDGLLCDVDEWLLMSTLVEPLIANEKKLAEFQEAARRRVSESFSLRNMVDALEDIYSKYENTRTTLSQ